MKFKTVFNSISRLWKLEDNYYFQGNLLAVLLAVKGVRTNHNCRNTRKYFTKLLCKFLIYLEVFADSVWVPESVIIYFAIQSSLKFWFKNLMLKSLTDAKIFIDFVAWKSIINQAQFHWVWLWFLGLPDPWSLDWKEWSVDQEH